MKDKLKALFETPKKAVLTTVCALAILATVGSGAAYATESYAKSSAIGADNAMQFAFVDAGVDPANAIVTSTDFDFEMGHFVYDVEFFANESEYNYWIKASDGTVLKKEIEIASSDGKTVTANATLTLDDAKRTALSDAGLSETEVVFDRGKLDVENGQTVYELSFSGENAEYEYEINADTGAIYSKSVDTYIASQDNIDANTNNSDPYEGASSASNSGSKSNASASNGGSRSDNSGANSHSGNDSSVASSSSGNDSSAASSSSGSDSSAASSSSSTDSSAASSSSGNTSSGSESSNSNASSSSNYIGIEKAKSIAVGKAGLSKGSVSFKKAKLDKDDGTVIYEIEFRHDGKEYDVEVHATTGKILDYDVERDDD